MRRRYRLALIALVIEFAGAAPIELHPRNPHYFLFHGRSVALITSGEHYGAVINAAFDYHRYLRTLAGEGLNYTRLFGGSYVEVPGKSFGIAHNTLAPNPDKFIAPWARSSEPGYAGGGNKFDLTRWDPEYYRRLREFLAEAGDRGIVVELTLFTSQYGEAQWQLSPFNRENNVNATTSIDWKKVNTTENGNVLKYQEAYVRKLVQEASRFDNVIFEIENEPWSDRPVLVSVINPYLPITARDAYPNSVEIADQASMAWQALVAGWIKAADASGAAKHLIAENYCNFRFSVRQLVAGVSVVNFHYAYPETVNLNYGLDRALSYDETGFLGQRDEVYRRQAWNFMLAGGSAFDGLDYSFSAGKESGADTTPNGPGGGSATLRYQLHLLGKFLNSFSLSDLHPDARVIQHAGGLSAHVLSNPGHEYAMYFDGDGPAEIRLRLPEGRYGGDWINTENGKHTPVQLKGGTDTVHTPEFQNGIALRLVRESSEDRSRKLGR
jgi:hypothetical protein